MDHLSASQINLYLLCSLKYRFQYLDELPKPFRPAALAFGSAFHAALAWLHKQMADGNGNGSDAGKALQNLRRRLVRPAAGYQNPLRLGQTEAGLGVLARELLRLYFARPQQRSCRRRSPFHGSVGESCHRQGTGCQPGRVHRPDRDRRHDRRVQDLGPDHEPQDVDNHLQLTAYSYAYEVLHQRPAKVLRIVDFVKTRTPKMVVLDTTRTKLDHQRFLCLAREVLGGIRAQRLLSEDWLLVPRLRVRPALQGVEGELAL